MAMPDALSCHPDHNPPDSNNQAITLLPDHLTKSLCLPSTIDEPFVKLTSQAIQGLTSPPTYTKLRHWRIIDGVLYFHNHAYVPPKSRKDHLQLHHDHL